MAEQEHYYPPVHEPVLRLVAMPGETNAFGDVFGGWIMAQVDIAGSIAVRRHFAGRVVTVAVNEFQFHKPVFVGDLISCYADITRIGRTSITAHVDVFANRYAEPSEFVRVTQADITYVAVDDQRRPRAIREDEHSPS